MSKIEKLSILGVRSFDNVRSETIQLSTPLTLIVGLNGSGKTTIIECLKFATTGDMPPNTKVGGAFIHDPKLCGEKEVLAQVKVSFKSTEGHHMVCTRNLQLTVKKQARSMKMLEGALNIVRNGERVSMSSRVAEMNTMVPRYLGVSKAVLDSVIFCHQEESLWPLSEPAKLKQRFDEIFEALKYTKAIDTIKVLAKQRREQLAVLKVEEQHCRALKNKGEEKQKQMSKLDDEITSLRAQSDEKSALIEEAASNAEAAWKQGQEANLIVGDLRGKRIERDTKQESVQNLRKNLNEMSESDADLQRMLDQYEQDVQDYERRLEGEKRKWHDLNQEVQATRGQISAKERECGSYEAQKDTQERQKQNRETLVKETARAHSIRGFDLDIDDKQVQNLMDRISKMAKDQNAAFERARRETSEELQRAQKALSEINEQKSALNQRKENSRQIIAGYDKKTAGLRSNANSINVDEGAIATMKSNEADIEAKIKSARDEVSNADWKSSIESLEEQLRKLDDRKEKLDAELVDATRQAGDSAQLDFVRKELKARQESLATMKGAHGDKISKMIGETWTPGTVESDFEQLVKQKAANVTDAERQREGTNREMSQINYKLNNCTTELKAKRKELKATEAAIRNAVDCEPAEYPEEVEKMEKSRDFVKADADSYSKVLEYFDSCVKLAKDHNGCKTCSRAFANSKELDKMLKTMETQRKKFEVSDDLQQDLASVEKDLQAARAVSSDFDTWERLKHKEIPALEKEEQQLSTKRERLIEQLEEQDGIVSEREAAKRDVEGMSKTVQTIAKYSNEIAAYESQTEELVAKQKSAGRSRGLEIIQEDSKKANEESRAVKTHLSKTTGDRDRSEKNINSMELEFRDLKSKRSTAEYQLKDKQKLDQQIEEYRALGVEQREAIKSIDQELQGLGPQLSQAQAKHDDISRRGADKDRELQAEYNKLNNSVNQLTSADKEIQAYIDRGGDRNLEHAKRDVENFKKELSRLEAEQSEVVKRIKGLDEQLRNHSETKRGIEDNQRFRHDLRALKDVSAEIEELEKHNAEEDKAMYDREGSKWQMKRYQLSAEHASLVGSLKSKDQQLDELIKEFETDYDGAGRKYKEAHIKSETTKACVEDLGRYSGALDKAIMKYHSLKMEQINTSIEELWRKTYQGTDVDTIMIKSENENAKSNKSYNYRVVMVKQDTEMDMRGRCSAGQKVLASIIIRLALAESFGTNCGLIALDEPTTNLDRENIEALARSLAEIVKERRKQKNFQLIIITHDEEFLKAMECSDFADNYWRVSRNEKQKSVIEKQSIAEVM
ncbi:DNA repair protein rad50 [Saxophila tyrrhenica]|uniref:DNA repair protein RAD50 n=1 Tax=Saxophila tyrrhenica TaxID=1690608 RepID=A0AAV9PE78_9PEZI|nr:DNA repair protein rad50 [Saxophila tyrrhenica]